MMKPVKCAPEVFAVVHKLCARLTRKTKDSTYLAAVHGSAENVETLLPRKLQHGEVWCRQSEQACYILLCAPDDKTAEQRLQFLGKLCPDCVVRIQRTGRRLRQDPTAYDEE